MNRETESKTGCYYIYIENDKRRNAWNWVIQLPRLCLGKKYIKRVIYGGLGKKENITVISVPDHVLKERETLILEHYEELNTRSIRKRLPNLEFWGSKDDIYFMRDHVKMNSM